MGDLGSDSASSLFSMGAKALEAILKIFQKIFEAWEKNPERELEKLKLKNAKTDLERQKILEKLNGKEGYVNYQELKKSGLELVPLGVDMTKEEMKEFSALCKRSGIIFSGMTEKDRIGVKEGVKTFELICPKKDLEKVLGIFDRLNDEKTLVGIEKRIAELEAKGDAMTEQDKVDIAQLKEQREAIQRSYCDRLNDEMSNSVVNRAITGEEGQKLTLDEALNRLTGRHIDKDIVCIVADANDPSKYIKCHGYQDIYNDKPYIKTEYEVFRDGKSVLKTHDGRFDGRPEGYWNEKKAEIQKAGDFSGTFLKFYSVAEHQEWAKETREQNAQELSVLISDKDKNYPVIIKELEMQLEERGATMADGKVYSMEYAAADANGNIVGLTEIVVKDDMSLEDKTNIAEMLLIGKQINNYNQLAELENELSLAKTNVFVANEGTDEKVAAEAELARVETKYNAALETEKQLITERKEINAVQAEQIVSNVPEQAKEMVLGADKQADRANDRDERAVSMEKSREVIEQKRAERLAKEDFKAGQSHNLDVKPKTSMSHGDR